MGNLTLNRKSGAILPLAENRWIPKVQGQSPPVKRSILFAAYLMLATGAVLLLFEGALRLAGLPKGLFHLRPPGQSGIYLPSATLHLVWTPIPYTIKTNALGFRGPEISLKKPEGIVRIVALGDSITDGFYVDNEDTYPFQLEQMLRAKGQHVEVINAAQGGTALDIQAALFRRYCLPLDPDAVVLVFDSNDIEDIRGAPLDELTGRELPPPRVESTSEWLLFGRTALGELLLDASLRRKFDRYRANRSTLNSVALEERYEIPGGAEFQANARLFLDKHAAKNDGIARYEEYTEAQRATIANYLKLLEHFHAYCRERSIKLLFVYYPDYPEIYLPERKVPLRGILKEGCETRGIPFLDLLPALRSRPGEVLHLAPLDFHPNPTGNRVIAEAIAQFLITGDVLRNANATSISGWQLKATKRA